MSKNNYKSKSNVSLRFESLESRNLMTVTYHGGAVMPKVEVQAVYYGRDWYNNSSLFSQTGAAEGFLNNIVHSSYMDMLSGAGYGVGRGSFDGGRIVLKDINKGNYLTDSQIQADLQSMISSGGLKNPLFDPNRLYVIFVEPGVAIKNDHFKNETSQADFLGYHGVFAGTGNWNSPFGQFHLPTNIHYAVIAYPGGWNLTSASQGFKNDFDQMTSVTSHELAESVTDPNVTYGKTDPSNARYKQLGWYDDAKGEIGDIVNSALATRDQNVYLNGYCVQRESDQSDNAMSPAGSTWYYYHSPISRIPLGLFTQSFVGIGGNQISGNMAYSGLTRALPSSENTSNQLAATVHHDESALDAPTNKLSKGTGAALAHLSVGAVDRVFGDLGADPWS